MECPKCHKIISDNATTCPHCRKVISLVCPNCHSISQSSVCSKCGYIILEKCAKCGRLTPVTNDYCKCGLSVKSSIACNECETDEFASITIKFGALRAIRNLLGSQELYTKFLVKLKNLVTAQLKGIEGNVITYGNDYVINLNKELSFPTSVNKAIRLSIKITNAFAGLNLRIQEELHTQLKLNIIIQKKQSEELLENKALENNIKLLTLKKNEKKYLKGMQIIMDQYSQDCISKDYKTDSLYMIETRGASVMYYELILENYVLPPGSGEDTVIETSHVELPKSKQEQEDEDIYGFKIFDIKAKCHFEKCYSDQLFTKIKPENRIISLKSDTELQQNTHELIQFFEKSGLNPIYISCTEDMNYKPWGFFEKIFKEYYGLSSVNGLIKADAKCGNFSAIKNLIYGKAIKAATPEDARYAYMDLFNNFLLSLKNRVIIADGFENIDDTSLQTLDLYFDRYKNVNVNFVFITKSDTSLHSKIKALLRTPLYSEFTIIKSNISTLLSNIKEDAEDFIQSFYYEKIKENFAGSKLYFTHALKYLADKDVLISFDNKLIIKNNNSVLIPKSLQSLIKARLKLYGKHKDASMILAYSAFLGERLDFETLNKLGIKNIDNSIKILQDAGFVHARNDIIYIDNYSLMRPVIQSSLKPETEEFLAKTILAKLGTLIDNTTLLSLMGIIKQYKEEYMLLWKNSQIAISTGDYDAYLKNCLGFLSIIDKIDNNIPQKEIEENKKEVFQNILMSLYSYSPAKIYSIENILLMDAIQEEDNDKIVKLSNLMLQGALISSNYTEAKSLLHNILSRMQNPTLMVDNSINARFLLLSLVNIEILFNIGDYRNCIDIGNDLLEVITPDIIEQIKPNGFSINLFVSHLAETFRLIAFAKLITNDDNLEECFESIKHALNEELPDKNAILAIKDFIKGLNYAPSNIEDASAFSKIIYLILQEITNLRGNYKDFAQNIYQAKLLAADIHQTQLEYICDLLIAYAYAKTGIYKKSNVIFNDVLEKSESSAIFNIVFIARYLIAKIKAVAGESEDLIILINDSLSELQKHNNEAKVFYAMFEKLYIDTQKDTLSEEELIIEQQKLLALSPNGEMERIIRSTDFKESEQKDFIKDTDDTEELSDGFNGNTEVH